MPGGTGKALKPVVGEDSRLVGKVERSPVLAIALKKAMVEYAALVKMP